MAVIFENLSLWSRHWYLRLGRHCGFIFCR